MKRSNPTYANPAPRKTKAERPCMKTWILNDVFSTKLAADDIAADWRDRNRQTARVVEKRIKAGGVWRDFYFIVVARRTGNPHEWKPNGTSTRGWHADGVDSREVHQRELCALCGAKRSRLIESNHKAQETP